MTTKTTKTTKSFFYIYFLRMTWYK